MFIAVLLYPVTQIAPDRVCEHSVSRDPLYKVRDVLECRQLRYAPVRGVETYPV